MPLKTLVKVGSVTNLSDARYCAGMGVDMLGFNVVAGTENHVTPSLYQDIRGWITGPLIVAEIYDIANIELARVIEQYAPSYVETSVELYPKLQPLTSLPFIVSIDKLTKELIESNPAVHYWQLTSSAAENIAGNYITKLLVRVNSVEEVSSILQRNEKPGIALSGSKEIRAGFKDYDDLAPIFDLLDE